jgi:hypothetical protein
VYDQVKPTIIVASDSRRYRSWGKGMTGLFPAAGHAASESIGAPRIALKEGAIRYSGGQPPADFRQAAATVILWIVVSAFKPNNL